MALFNSYQPYQVYNPYQQYYAQAQTQQQTPQIQNGGFVLVKDIEEARNYPVAPNVSVIFKNENAPYIYTKTLGLSQLDQPIFETYRLIKEEDNPQVVAPVMQPPTIPNYLSVEEADIMRNEINTLKEELAFLKEYIEEDSRDVKHDKPTIKPDEQSDADVAK